MSADALDFNRITCLPTQDMLNAVRELGLLEFVRDYEDTDRGFMFSNHPDANKIASHQLVLRHRHSGASFGMCCRNVQFIAKQGLDAWCARFENAAH
jgi:hypothetical protein